MKIGVLGGIGPEATGIFYLKLVSKLQSSGIIKSNRDFPQILINSIPAPELILENISKQDLKEYKLGLKELDKASPDFIVMVCNTIHLFCDELQKTISTKILDLRKEIHLALEEKEVRKITVIGTPDTLSNGLYRFPNIDYINPSEKETKLLSKLIFQFNQGIEKDKQKEKAKKIVKKYIYKGSQLILLGCTEFAVMLEDLDFPILNSIDVLADVIVERCKN